MGVRLSDLPPDVQKRVIEGSPERLRRTDERMKTKSRRGTGDAQPCSGSCSGCGETFDRYTRWERHHDAGCVGRWVIDL